MTMQRLGAVERPARCVLPRPDPAIARGPPTVADVGAAALESAGRRTASSLCPAISKSSTFRTGVMLQNVTPRSTYAKLLITGCLRGRQRPGGTNERMTREPIPTSTAMWACDFWAFQAAAAGVS
jgi:hypothetical protein